ncbi:MAG: Ig-like domain-containing protein, partial [Candidatus Cloacimonadaceae bacterium]|nr:Ig-like domain-containing protein [Candidatus Cloacimonadaceae bacterium]
MNRVFKYASLLLAALILVSCGSKRPPTGGPVDTEKPVIIATVPEAYGDISQGRIEISFSKPLDRSTLTSAIYIYPPVNQKKITYESNTILIRILEPLQKDTNYFVTLTTRLKDTRGNALEKNQSIVYRSGNLNDNRISGNIIYEDQKDNGLPIQLNLLSADSLMVMSTQISGSSYILQGLNDTRHIVRAYIDKNRNGRFDFSQEPFFESATAAAKIVNLDLNMAYADSTLPQIKSIRAVSNREVELIFSEEVRSFEGIGIVSNAGGNPLQIKLKHLAKDRLFLITAEQDTSRYRLVLEGLRDLKGNVSKSTGMQFSGTTRIDTSPPAVIGSKPRNGTSVNDLLPNIEITFSKIMPPESLKYKLLSADRKEEIPLVMATSDGFSFSFVPRKPLQNYRHYIFWVDKETT